MRRHQVLKHIVGLCALLGFLHQTTCLDGTTNQGKPLGQLGIGDMRSLLFHQKLPGTPISLDSKQSLWKRNRIGFSRESYKQEPWNNIGYNFDWVNDNSSPNELPGLKTAQNLANNVEGPYNVFRLGAASDSLKRADRTRNRFLANPKAMFKPNFGMRQYAYESNIPEIKEYILQHVFPTEDQVPKELLETKK